MDYQCPQRDLGRVFEPVVRPPGRQYVADVPVSQSPVRYQASEQCRPVTRKKPYSQESLKFRCSEQCSPYRGSGGVKPKC